MTKNYSSNKSNSLPDHSDRDYPEHKVTRQSLINLLPKDRQNDPKYIDAITSGIITTEDYKEMRQRSLKPFPGFQVKSKTRRFFEYLIPYMPTLPIFSFRKSKLKSTTKYSPPTIVEKESNALEKLDQHLPAKQITEADILNCLKMSKRYRT